MRLRTLLASIAAATLVLAIQTVQARSIAVDPGINCTTQVSPAADGSIALPSDGSTTANTANAGESIATLLVWACADSSGTDAGATSLTFDPAHSPLYTWIDSTQSPPSVVTTNPTSNLAGLDAQVAVFTLLGAYAGDFEVQVNYDLCPPASAPSLTWFGHTYDYTGATSLCDASVTSDFLFSANGTVLGSIEDLGTVVLDGNLPTGWSLAGSHSVMEPGMLGLLGSASVLLLLLRRRGPIWLRWPESQPAADLRRAG